VNANFGELRKGEVRRMLLLRLSEKSRYAPNRGLKRQQKEFKKAYFSAGPLTKSELQTPLYAFSDSFSTLDFSHLEAKGIGYARHQLAQKR
jgi:hypothetical protein